MRYYQSMIDIDSLMKGEEYENLKESYILFICKDDPFKDDKENLFSLPCYTFKNTCAENDAVNLDDKTVINYLQHIIFMPFYIKHFMNKNK